MFDGLVVLGPRGQIRGERLLDLARDHLHGGPLKTVAVHQVHADLLRVLAPHERLLLSTACEAERGHVVAYPRHVPLHRLTESIHPVLAVGCCIVLHRGRGHLEIRRPLPRLLQQRRLAHVLLENRRDWFIELTELDLRADESIDEFIHGARLILAPIDGLGHARIVPLVEEAVAALEARHPLILPAKV